MILIPQVKTNIGLIQQCNIHGVIKVSSTNFDNNRKENPINYTSTDRWCSNATGKNTEQWWKVTFDHWIYPTNYSISNNIYGVIPVAWKLQGKKKNNNWIDLSVIDQSPIHNNDFEVFTLDVDDGPFQTFRLISTENGINQETGERHFCIYKFELFGMAFKNFCISVSMLKIQCIKPVYVITLLYPLFVE